MHNVSCHFSAVLLAPLLIRTEEKWILLPEVRNQSSVARDLCKKVKQNLGYIKNLLVYHNYFEQRRMFILLNFFLNSLGFVHVTLVKKILIVL